MKHYIAPELYGSNREGFFGHKTQKRSYEARMNEVCVCVGLSFA